MVNPPRQLSDGEADRHDEPSDSELIQRSITDPKQFMPLLDRHHRVLFGYLARRVGRDIAEDVTSETFTRAFAQRERYDLDRADARPWLFGIATNLLRNHARSEVRQLRAYSRHGIDKSDTIDDTAINSRLDAMSQSSELAQALKQLSPGDRDTLLLYAWNDMSYEDIAETLEIPVGTVRSRMNRARRVVRTQLTQTSDGQEAASRG